MHGQAEAILVAYDIMEVDGRDVRRRGFRCLAGRHRRARMNVGGGVHRPCRLESPPSPRRSTAGLFLCGFPAPPPGAPLNDLARCGALEEDEHAGGGSQLPLLAMPSNLAPLASGTKGDAYGGRSDLGVCGKHARYLSRS